MKEDEIASKYDELMKMIDAHTDDVADARIRFHKNHNLHAYQLRLKKANDDLYDSIKSYDIRERIDENSLALETANAGKSDILSVFYHAGRIRALTALKDKQGDNL